jgi:hypothetical protein
MKQRCVLVFMLIFLLMVTNVSIIGAQDAIPQFLFAHDNDNHTIVKIDTLTGLATVVGPTNFLSWASGIAVSRGPVPGPDGIVFPSGTLFGLFRDNLLGKDFVVVIDTTTGEAIKVVQTERLIVDRGIAFGPDGVTLFLMEGNGYLSIIDTVTGSVTPVGYTGFSDDALEFDPDSGVFFAIPKNTLITIDPLDASATVVGNIGGLGNLDACTIVRSPEGTWFTINRRTKELVTIDITTGTVSSVIGKLGPNVSKNICATGFAPERPFTVKVSIDIKPQSCPNPLNTNSHGVLPVAILGDENLDVTFIDPDSIQLEGVAPIRNSIEDVSVPIMDKRYECDCITGGQDGFDDMVFKFDVQEIMDALGDITDGEELVLTLTGNLLDGTSIIGEDCVIVISKKGKSKK